MRLRSGQVAVVERVSRVCLVREDIVSGVRGREGEGVGCGWGFGVVGVGLWGGMGIAFGGRGEAPRGGAECR